MKTKLLKRLRKRTTIGERNGGYSVILSNGKPIEPGECFKFSLEQCLIVRRAIILHHARAYIKPKRIIR